MKKIQNWWETERIYNISFFIFIVYRRSCNFKVRLLKKKLSKKKKWENFLINMFVLVWRHLIIIPLKASGMKDFHKGIYSDIIFIEA